MNRSVYRDQIGTSLKLSEELQILFGDPVFRQYQQEHQAKFKPTEKEIATAIAFYSRDESIIEDCQEIDKLTQSELESLENQLKRSHLKSAKRKATRTKTATTAKGIKAGRSQRDAAHDAGMLECWNAGNSKTTSILLKATVEFVY